MDEMVSLYISKVLNARQFCSLMHKAGKVGMAAALLYGLDPARAASGHFNRHLRRVMPRLARKREMLYPLLMPGSARKATGRVEHQVQAFVPHEKLHYFFKSQWDYKLRL